MYGCVEYVWVTGFVICLLCGCVVYMSGCVMRVFFLSGVCVDTGVHAF